MLLRQDLTLATPYAFATCGYHRVFAGTILISEPSWKLRERLGLRKEAHFRAKPGGRWIDSVRYAVLASERMDRTARGVCVAKGPGPVS